MMRLEPFEMSFEVRWSDLDSNVHVRHSAYADYCATTRVQCLAKRGFAMKDFGENHVGPVLFKETLTYLKEIPPDVTVRVTMKIAGLSKDGRKWRIRHELYRSSDQAKAAIVEVEGAWMDTRQRKIAPPPSKLRQAFEGVERCEDFSEI
jgi:acyl-CoA thioester hydrolase